MSLQLGANKVPAGQAAAPPGQSTLTGEELLQTQKALHLCVQGPFGRVQLFAIL